MVLRIVSFSLLVGLTLNACVIVPGPAFSRTVETTARPTGPLTPDDHIVVLAAGASVRDDDSTTICVRKSLLRERPAVRLVPAGQFRDAVRSYRWPFKGPQEDIQRVMEDPLVRDAVAR